MRETLINGRWPIILPDHRADFHEARPWWEAARLADMHAWLATDQMRQGPLEPRILDVGSEEGDLTALYASWGCKVSFIDPSEPWVYQTLETLEANGLVFWYCNTAFAGPASQGGRAVRETRFAVRSEESAIAVTTLDEVPLVDAVTIDVEGDELAVLAGATNLLKQGVVWWISIHGDVDPHAETPSSVHAYMREFGYKDQWLGHQHEWFYRFYR